MGLRMTPQHCPGIPACSATAVAAAAAKVVSHTRAVLMCPVAAEVARKVARGPYVQFNPASALNNGPIACHEVLVQGLT